MKANFGILPAIEADSKLGKRERGKAYAERALSDLRADLNKENRVVQPTIPNPESLSAWQKIDYPSWQTVQDTPDKVSAESFQGVGKSLRGRALQQNAQPW